MPLPEYPLDPLNEDTEHGVDMRKLGRSLWLDRCVLTALLIGAAAFVAYFAMNNVPRTRGTSVIPERMWMR